MLRIGCLNVAGLRMKDGIAKRVSEGSFCADGGSAVEGVRAESIGVDELGFEDSIMWVENLINSDGTVLYWVTERGKKLANAKVVVWCKGVSYVIMVCL